MAATDTLLKQLSEQLSAVESRLCDRLDAQEAALAHLTAKVDHMPGSKDSKKAGHYLHRQNTKSLAAAPITSPEPSDPGRRRNSGRTSDPAGSCSSAPSSSADAGAGPSLDDERAGATLVASLIEHDAQMKVMLGEVRKQITLNAAATHFGGNGGKKGGQLMQLTTDALGAELRSSNNKTGADSDDAVAKFAANIAKKKKGQKGRSGFAAEALLLRLCYVELKGTI